MILLKHLKDIGKSNFKKLFKILQETAESKIPGLMLDQEIAIQTGLFIVSKFRRCTNPAFKQISQAK